MGELIIPAGVKADYRPYRAATTSALLYELQQRQAIAELSGQIMMPKNELLDEEHQNALRIEQFKTMAQQMGLAIAQSPYAFTGVSEQQNLVDPEKTDEVLVMQVLLAVHPKNPMQPLDVPRK